MFGLKKVLYEIVNENLKNLFEAVNVVCNNRSTKTRKNDGARISNQKK